MTAQPLRLCFESHPMTGPYAAQMIEALLPEPVEVARRHLPGGVNITLAWTRQQMLQYGALVRAAALEEAARVCEARAVEYAGLTEEENASEACAAAIRAASVSADKSRLSG